MKHLTIKASSTIINALKQIGRSAEKNLVVVDENGKLKGTLSDGDLRRAILNKKKFTDKIFKIYNKKPIFFYKDSFDIKTIKSKLISNKIFFAPIIDKKKYLVDVVTWNTIFGNKKIDQNFNKKIPVVIMAGGKGTRLEPFTKVLPKPLIPIDDKTVIERIIEKFRNFGLDTFYISINYKSKIIKSFFEELNPNYKVKFLEEKKPLGTIGSLGFIKQKINEDIIITNSDIIVDLDIKDFYNFHKDNKNDLSIVVAAKEYEIPYGSCEINSKGKLTKINEKPILNFLVNTGLYILNNASLKKIKKNKRLDMDELINHLLKKKKKVMVFPVSEKSWIDIGQWVEYKKTIEKLN